MTLRNCDPIVNRIFSNAPCRLAAALIWAWAVLNASSAAAGTDFPALNGDRDAAVLKIYSSLDEDVSEPLIAAFQRRFQSIAVQYHDLQSLEIYERVIDETDTRSATADLVISSAMDLQVKLANDGYAQPVQLTTPAGWPDWAVWRRTAFGLTFEPAVIVYHKPTFEKLDLPTNRAKLMDLLAHEDEPLYGKIATYDIERAGLGFLFMARDIEHNRDIWRLIARLGGAGVRLYSSSSAILERVADGRFALGYNILGSYARNWADRNPDLGIILPEDYTVVMSRIALVPQAAGNVNLGRQFLAFLMSEAGQQIMAREAKLPVLHPNVPGANTLAAMQNEVGNRLRPIPIGPGLVAYLDQVKRARLIKRWNETLRGN